jgi:Tfp pilus assembly protein FimT
MVALAVASILLGIGIPSFSAAVQNSRVSANYSSFAQAIYIARSEAVKRSDFVTICPRAVGEIDSCGSDWTKGILVFADDFPVITAATATLGAEDTVLHSQAELRKGSTITAWSSNDRTESSVGPAFMLRYRGDGDTDWENGYFSICDDDRGAKYSKTLNIVLTGDIRRGRPVSASDPTPKNVFGTALTCSS